MHILIVGGGLAAVRAAESARQSGFDGEITLLSDEPYLPYHRPPLSKEALAEAPSDDLWIHPQSFFDEHQVELLRNRAVRLDPHERRVELDDGARLAFDRLLIATGSRSRRLHTDGVGLEGIHYLRTLDDSQAVARRLSSANDVVIVGAGLIGLEVASVAREARHRHRQRCRTAAPRLGRVCRGAHRPSPPRGRHRPPVICVSRALPRGAAGRGCRAPGRYAYRR